MDMKFQPGKFVSVDRESSVLTDESFTAAMSLEENPVNEQLISEVDAHLKYLKERLDRLQ